jgi:hypothetical protein
MSVNTSCGLMVGLPYYSVVDIEYLLENELLEIGSVHYDSDRSQNIVGFFIKECDSYTALSLESVMHSYKEFNTKFYKITGQFGNLYMTLHIT